MTTLLNRLVREESGQDLIEYGLLIGIITAVVVAAICTAIGARVPEVLRRRERGDQVGKTAHEGGAWHFWPIHAPTSMAEDEPCRVDSGATGSSTNLARI